MSVYSYVELKVHTNVRKVGTHLNVYFVYRTYVRWKYTFMFDYNNERSIYLYIMNISLSRPFSTFSLSLLYYIYIRETLFPARSLPFTTHLCLPLYSFIIYTLYIERNILSRNFLPLFHTFIILLLYIENDIHFSRPLFTPL